MALTPSGNFAQKLLGALVQFGKGFANLQGVSATQLAVRNAGNTANAKLTIADGTASSDAASVGQLGVGNLAGFGADALVGLTTAPGVVPPGSRAVTVLTSVSVPSFLVSRASSVSTFAMRHTGDAANVGGQTIAYLLKKTAADGTITPIDTITLVTTTGVSHTEHTFAPVVLAAGDSLSVTGTASALLIALCTSIQGGAG